jgi:hypothetical protein
MLIFTFKEVAEQSDSEDADSSAAKASSTPAESAPQATPPAPAKPLVATGPTDEDPEEAEALKEEIQALTDGSLQMGPEEMEAYDRLVRWANSQPFELLQKRARKHSVLADFMQFPDKQRGRLFTLKLNVRRILPVDKTRDGIALHEVWGWTTESKAWLYAALVVDLPPDMPTGPDVNEKATLVGYFFKLQGYHEAGAKPNARPLNAPLFVGRLTWQPAQVVKANSNDWLWVWVVAGALVVIMIAQFGISIFWRKRPASAPLSAASVTREARMPIEDWLQGGGTTEIPDGNKPGRDGE